MTLTLSSRSRPVSRLRLRLRHHLAGAAALGLALVACRPISRVPLQGGRGTLEFYTGPECNEVRDSEITAGRRDDEKREVEYDPRLHALLAICDQSRVARNPKDYSSSSHVRKERITRFDVVDMHANHDGRPLSPVKTALFVVTVVDGNPTISHGEKLEGLREQLPPLTDPSRQEVSQEPPRVYGKLGIAAMYAKQTDRAALERELREARMPEQALALFLARFDAAARFVYDRIDPLPKIQRHVFYDVPVAALKERKLQFELHRSLFERLDEAHEDRRTRPTPALSDELAALRSEYVKACGGPGCVQDAFYTAATRERALLCVALRDALCAHAETEVLRRPGAFDGRFADVVSRAQKKAAERSREAYDLQKKTWASKVDEATTAELLKGVDPVLFKPEHFHFAETLAPRYAEVFDVSEGRAKTETGILAAARKKGDRVELEFKGGDPRPVRVPAREAEGLQPGEEVSVILMRVDEGRAALVMNARRGKELVQLRGDRLPAGAR